MQGSALITGQYEKVIRSQDNSLHSDQAMNWISEELRFDSRQGEGIFFFF